MKQFQAAVAAFLFACTSSAALAQQPAQPAVPFQAGKPLQNPSNVKTFGSFMNPESVVHDEVNDRYIVVSTGVPNSVRKNDGYVSIVNPDGTVHTLKWIAGTPENGIELNDPRGSDIGKNGVLYVADNTVVRMFDVATGQPKGNVTIDGAVFLNDLEVADDGTVYVTDSGSNDNPGASAIYRISPDGQVSKLVSGEALARPNGIAIDRDGNIVTVALGNTDVVTYSRDGNVLKKESNLSTLNDGLVILADGSKITSSLRAGHIVRIPAQGGPAEVLAENIPQPASIGFDAKRNRVIIPQLVQNALTFVDLK
jgi:hypothetical protein